jgi:hypothetical protein
MDSAKRERLIQLGAQIIGLRTEIAPLQSQLVEAEAEWDRLISETTASSSPATNNAASPAPEPSDGLEKMLSKFPEPLRVPKRPEPTVPPVIGSLSDQALAVLKANPDLMFSGEAITECLNRMVGRVTSANLDSVNAALSRLTTDGVISRVERGLYRAKPAMNTS